jgi:hypothetical protein
MTNENKRPAPVYKGELKHVYEKEGFAVWLPDDWFKINMKEGHIGWIFSPYRDQFDTSFTVEKHMLDYSVTPEDKEILLEGFKEGILSFDDAEIQEIKSDSGEKAIILEAKFTFTEKGQKRYRWLKSMYWGDANLVLIAQGANEEEYKYWMPMLYNAMYNYELGIA